MPRYDEFTEAELVRYALKKGRTRPPNSVEPSQLLPSFAEALKRATVDDLEGALQFFARRLYTSYSARRYRMRAIAAELVLRSGEAQ